MNDRCTTTTALRAKSPSTAPLSWLSDPHREYCLGNMERSTARRSRLSFKTVTGFVLRNQARERSWTPIRALSPVTLQPEASVRRPVIVRSAIRGSRRHWSSSRESMSHRYLCSAVFANSTICTCVHLTGTPPLAACGVRFVGANEVRHRERFLPSITTSPTPGDDLPPTEPTKLLIARDSISETEAINHDGLSYRIQPDCLQLELRLLPEPHPSLVPS